MEASRISEDLPRPQSAIETPAFIILEDAVRHNIKKTIATAGGAQRLMPHVKTHRSHWVTKALTLAGINSFKAATPAEIEMALEAGASRVMWAYPTSNQRLINRVVTAALNHADAVVIAAVNERAACQLWISEISKHSASNVRLAIDLESGVGRTGVPMGPLAASMAAYVHEKDLLYGWHIYDGHIQDRDRQIRTDRVARLAEQFLEFVTPLKSQGVAQSLIAGSSWSYDLWRPDVANQVSPGSFIYSSSQHHEGLPEHDWALGAYVLSSVVSRRRDTVTLDAGSKSISPDKPLKERFIGGGPIISMMEEHTIVRSETLQVGDCVALVPGHTCTTAYLFDKALVQTSNGTWESRTQLGSKR